ncbi:retrovirus-related pol polyprotein from transposon TNT 1-94 [Tanacetum coccineum]
MLTSDSSDDNKGVSSEGPSITSIPKEGPSIARRSKEPIPKEFLMVMDIELLRLSTSCKEANSKTVSHQPYSNQRIVMENQSDVQNHLVEIQADDHDLLVNSNNENDDMLGYESEKYSDDEDADGTNHAEDADGTNHSDLKLVKRGITRLYKFRREYGKPGGIKIKKEADNKIKEGTLNLDDGTDVMTIVFGKEKRRLCREWKWSYIQERRERQQKDELVKKLSTEMTKKDVLVNKLSNEMTETKGMLSQLMNQLAAQGVQLNLSSQLQVASDVTPMGAYEVDGTQSSVVVRDKDARIKKKSNGLVTSEKAPVKAVRTRKTISHEETGLKIPNRNEMRLQHKNYQQYVFQHKSNIVALGTVYKSAGKQMLHNQALPNDCYKVSIDSSLVDAACIPDVGNNGLKTVKDGVGGFFAWPKNQVVLDEEVTPPTTIQKISDYNSAPKLQSKRKSYVSRETMQRQARTGKSHKIISLRRGVKPRNPQHVMKSCKTCGSTVHTTTDHNDIELFRRGEELQAKKAEALKSSKAESSNANRYKTQTRNGCSRHMTGVKSYLQKYVEQPGPKVVFRIDSTCTTESYGSIKCNGIVFTKVAFVNGLKYNLISISQLCDAKYIIQFDEKRGTIFNSNKKVVMITPRVRDVYVLDMTSSTQESCFFAKASENLNWLWHKGLAHLNFKKINKLAKQNLGKHHRAIFKIKQTSYIKKCIHLLHMDLFGPVTPRSINHEKYTLVIVDEYSRWSQDKHIELVNIISNPRAGMLTRAMAKELSAASAHECLFVEFLFEKEPKKVAKALKHPGRVDSMQDELNQFARNKVWTLVPAPYGKTIIGLKWVFGNKRDETRIVIKNKARLVAQGYNQQ